MPTPGQEIFISGILSDSVNSRANRAGIPVEGQPGLISRADPPDSYEGMFAINTPERVDLVIDKRDKSRLRIKYTAET